MSSKSKPIISAIFSQKEGYVVSSSLGEREYTSKKTDRNSSNLPLSAYNASTWCHLFANLYKKTYGKTYENYRIRLGAEATVLANVVYPYAFDGLGYSAREFALFLETYLRTSYNAQRDLVVMMLANPASFSKMEYYIKKYRRVRKKDRFESLIYIPHTPLTDDPDDLQLILESSNLTPIQMLSNYGISIFHRYLQLYGPMSYEEATKRTYEIVMNEILIKYHSDKEFIKQLFRMVTKSSILWEPFANDGHVKGLKVSAYYSLDWRREFGEFWKQFKFYREDWWRTEAQTSALRPVPTVKKFFNVQPK